MRPVADTINNQTATKVPTRGFLSLTVVVMFLRLLLRSFLFSESIMITRDQLPPLIALTGPAGSGKNYAAERLASLLGHQHNIGSELLGFADGLKEMVAGLMCGGIPWTDA